MFFAKEAINNFCWKTPIQFLLNNLDSDVTKKTHEIKKQSTCYKYALMTLYWPKSSGLEDVQ